MAILPRVVRVTASVGLVDIMQRKWSEQKISDARS